MRSEAGSSPASVTVADLSERELVARIQQHLTPAPDWLLVGIGDDAAVVAPERNRVEVLTIDAIVEGVHFDRTFVPPGAIGHRALAVNLSDLAAMGAAPRLALLSMVLPSAFPLAEFDAIAGGMAALAARHRLHVVGGNLTRSPGPLMIDVAVMGTVKRRQALTRGGARPGDDVYVSGSIGLAAAGLRRLREVVSRQPSVINQQSLVASLGRQTEDRRLVTDDVGLTTDDWRLVTAYLHPVPRVRLGLLVARNRAAAACIDLSDGLADAVHQMADASGVGMTIDAGALPIDPCARAFFEAHGGDAVIDAVTGGDDYELLLAARPRMRGRLAAAAGHGNVPLTRIGRCTDDRAVMLQRTAGDTVRDALPMPGGYSHFAPLKGSRSDA
jgi:thiamine-monophosphate kinase